MKKENIQSKLSNLTCKDDQHKFYSSLSQVYTNDNVMLVSDGFRAGMYFKNNDSDSYTNLPIIDPPLINAIQTVIKQFVYESQVDVNRKILKDIITNQASDVKEQSKDYYNWRKQDTKKNTTKLIFDIQNNTMTIISYSYVSKLSGYDTKNNIHIPKFEHKSFVSDVSYPYDLNILPIFVHRPNRFSYNIIPIVFDTQFLLDMINFHNEDTLQMLIYDSKSGVMPVMSKQSDRLMLLLPIRNPQDQEDE